jgi:hypothetical protein
VADPELLDEQNIPTCDGERLRSRKADYARADDADLRFVHRPASVRAHFAGRTSLTALLCSRSDSDDRAGP